MRHTSFGLALILVLGWSGSAAADSAKDQTIRRLQMKVRSLKRKNAALRSKLARCTCLASAATSSSELAAAIKTQIRLSKGKRRIRRKLLRAILCNTTWLARQARIVPMIKQGKPHGMRLFAIRPGSLFNRLGLRNGDAVVSINGRSTADPTKVLEIHKKGGLRAAKKIVFQVERRGRPVSLTLIVD